MKYISDNMSKFYIMSITKVDFLFPGRKSHIFIELLSSIVEVYLTISYACSLISEDILIPE
jgi:hypothetical protein